MLSRLLRCISTSVRVRFWIQLLVTVAVFSIFVCVCVCRCPLRDAVKTVPFCVAFSILVPSVSRNTSRHSIHHINSQGAFCVLVSEGACETVNVHRGHAFVFVSTWMCRVNVCIYSTFVCIECVCLQMPSVHPGPSAFYVRRQQEQAESIQVASRANNSYE